MFKLARTWKQLRELLAAIAKTVAEISNFLILLILFMTIASLLGMELFAYKLRFDKNDHIAEDP
jgi:FtsH-binding integral membrane protein